MNKAGVTILIDHFSCGLRAHLSFAVATFLEPDIQLVDNILAVGDPRCRSKHFGNKLAWLPSQKSRSSHRRIVNASQFLSHRDRWADVLNLPGHVVRFS